MFRIRLTNNNPIVNESQLFSLECCKRTFYGMYFRSIAKKYFKGQDKTRNSRITCFLKILSLSQKWRTVSSQYYCKVRMKRHINLNVSDVSINKYQLYNRITVICYSLVKNCVQFSFQKVRFILNVVCVHYSHIVRSTFQACAENVTSRWSIKPKEYIGKDNYKQITLKFSHLQLTKSVRKSNYITNGFLISKLFCMSQQ